ncbi:hypothetical protein Bca4012_065707 [Brassica carinata]|uniref:Protein IQ-DOMAIN 1 n=1 Tax=Brassica carinata TaxID=52824 RepID=A0A8X7VPN1_BRACI|nr:hypothetical protein Bca52824_018019 [Brassica carinata]
MGVTRGLVRSIFFRNKSFGAHDYKNGRSNVGEKKRWSSVRSYLCGDEFNSVLAVDDSGSIKHSLDPLLTMSQQLSSEPSDSVLAIQDSASVKLHLEEEEDSVSGKNSEVSVTQPLNKSEATETHILNRHHQTTLISKLFLEEDAAIIIQSAFRSYLAKRWSKEVEETLDKEKSFSGEESQGKVSMGTSLEVQACSSVKAPFFRRKRVSRTLHKNNNTQVLRIKEEWDDSTVSSTISKSRIQSRIEAMTKRERALAYAFSQQLRICAKKKQVEHDEESNIGWSWLERWMATRAPEIEARTNIQAMKSQRLVGKNRSFSIGGELESCASNDIPLQFESISEELQREKSSVISKPKSVASYKTQRRHNNRLQGTKKDLKQQNKKAKTAPKMGNEHEETSRGR